MGEQHANGWRVSRHRLVADATVGVIATAGAVPIDGLSELAHLGLAAHLVLASSKDIGCRLSGCGYSQPFSCASRAAWIRLRASSFWIAVDT
jgi:hypothetical protein